MKTDTDFITTVAGGAIAAGSAAQVALQQMQPGTSMHQGDWIQLAFSVLVAVFSYFTNKKSTP